MKKNNLYIIPKEDINEYLDYDDITIFPTIKRKPIKAYLKQKKIQPISLISEIKEQRSIIDNLISEKEELSTKFLKVSSYISPLEQALSLQQEKNLDSLMLTLEVLQNNSSFLDVIINKLS